MEDVGRNKRRERTYEGLGMEDGVRERKLYKSACDKATVKRNCCGRQRESPFEAIKAVRNILTKRIE